MLKLLKSFILISLLSTAFYYPAIHAQPVKSHNGSKDSVLVEKREVNKDTTKTVRIKLTPIKTLGFEFSKNFFNLKSKQFYRKDYRFVGDVLTYIPFAYSQDLGWLGQPSEIMLYGLGFGNISYLNNSLTINNRITNSLDLNLVQSEDLDSITVTPLYNGFVFNLFNNPVTTIFNYANEFVKVPYSRIRYYQAPNSEAFVDAIFKTRIQPKLYGQFEVTNNSIDNGYKNSNFSAWKIHSSLRYMFNKSLNLVGTYNFTNQYTGLFGGVNRDSILNIEGSSFNEILYNRIEAPVMFPDMYKKTKRHNFVLSLLTNLGNFYSSNFNLYYQFHLTEFRQNEKKTDPGTKTIFDNNKYKSYGLNFLQHLKTRLINLSIISNYERTEFNTPLLSDNPSITSFSIAGIASSKLINGLILPSIFAKYLNSNNEAYFGAGGALSISLSGKLNIYGGYSSLQKPLPEVYKNINYAASQGESNLTEKLRLLEIGIKVDLPAAKGVLKFFHYKNDNEPLSFLNSNSYFPKSIYVTDFTLRPVEYSGINITATFKFWKILIEANGSYYFQNANFSQLNLPDYTFRGGIYFKGFLFQNNLDLKSGFNFQFATGENFRYYDFERNISSNSFFRQPALFNIDLLQVPQYFAVDFFTAGRVQERAIVYFVIENLFDSKYFIVPYYPKQERGLKIGISWEFLN